jgi:glutathione S-transferase
MGANFEIATVDMKSGGHETAAFLAISPIGEPGVLVDDEGPDPGVGLTMWGPLSVAVYLDDQKTRLNLPGETLIPPNPCGLPLAFQWAHWAASNVLAPMQAMVLHGNIKPVGGRDGVQFAAAKQRVDAAMTILEGQAPAAGQFINRHAEHPNGDNGTFSAADAFLGAALTYERIFKPGHRFMDNFPKVSAYLAALEARPSFQTAFGGVTITPSPGDIVEPPT